MTRGEDMRMRELRALIIYCFGLLLFIGSWWLCWDYLLSLFKWAVDWDRCGRLWFFHLPFMVYEFRYPELTSPFDLALAMSIVSLMLTSLGAYLVGRYKE